MSTDAQVRMPRRERRHRRWSLMAVAGMAAAAGPFAFAPGRADAGVTSDTQTGSLTFVTGSLTTVTCTLQADAVHNGDGHSGSASQRTNLTSGSGDRVCDGEQVMNVSYKDTGGHTAFIETQVFDSSNANTLFSNVSGNIRITHTVTFEFCNPNASATCVLTLHTAPK